MTSRGCGEFFRRSRSPICHRASFHKTSSGTKQRATGSGGNTGFLDGAPRYHDCRPIPARGQVRKLGLPFQIPRPAQGRALMNSVCSWSETAPWKNTSRGWRQSFCPARPYSPGRIARQDMVQYYSAADLFAFPGIGESLGMVYLEAQACGLPVVALDSPGVSQVVVGGQTGLLVAEDAGRGHGGSDWGSVEKPGNAKEVRRGRP